MLPPMEDYLGLDSICNINNEHSDCQNNHLLYFNKKTGRFQTISLDTADIIVIQDYSYSKCIASFTIAEENDYLLHHSHGDTKDYSLFVNQKEGLEQRDDPKYHPTFEIIFNNVIPADQKAGKIIEYLFPDSEKKLNAALEFLHGCLVKNAENADYQKLKDTEIDISNLPKLKGEPLSEEYTKSLSDLRDDLLKKILSTD
jgi:hypothetical protein